MTTLAERVYGQLTGEEAMPVYKPDEIPEEARSHDAGHDCTEHSDLLEFTAVYGLAWGIARGEDPFLSQEEVAAAAFGAACQAFRWHTTVGGRGAGQQQGGN